MHGHTQRPAALQIEQSGPSNYNDCIENFYQVANICTSNSKFINYIILFYYCQDNIL